MEAAKKSAANVAASAKSGMEKTKAVVTEKAEKLTTSDPVQRQMATEKKEQRIHQAEMDKLAAQEQNAASRQEAATGGTTAYTATGGGVGLGHTTTGTHGMTAGHTGLGHTTGTHGITPSHTGLGHTAGTHDVGVTGTHGTAAGHAIGVMPGGLATGTTTGSGRATVQGPNTGGRHGSSTTDSAF
ncbi:hypothetical protein AABB24_018147 [Solanum stoloniferum]|uniref:Uncharacterized protein n=1 Tax=Solanum stoloniferum TaxID=62892 RepID=A0ABD2TND8_9SOLN